MLSEHPDYYELFKFRNIATTTKDEQAQDERLRSHGENVMRVLGQAIRYKFIYN